MRREPRNWKHKRTFKFKNKIETFEPSMSHLCFSNFGLVVEKDIFLDYNQLFTIYRLLKKKFKKKCYLKFNISCILPFTKKPVSARMGKGKGAWKGFNVFVRKGTIILELGNISKLKAIMVFIECSQKLPVKTRLINLKN